MPLTQTSSSAPVSFMASNCTELAELQQLFRLKVSMQKLSSIHVGFMKRVLFMGDGNSMCKAAHRSPP